MDETAAGAVLIVRLPAEIDIANCADVAASLDAAIDNAALVIADMTGTSFCDSSGMQVLLIAHQRAVARGTALRIAVRPGGGVARVLGIVGMDRILRIYPRLQDAVPAESAAIQPTA